MPPLQARDTDPIRAEGFEAEVRKRLKEDEEAIAKRCEALAGKLCPPKITSNKPLNLVTERAIYTLEDGSKVAAWLMLTLDHFDIYNPPHMHAVLMTEEVDEDDNLAGNGKQRVALAKNIPLWPGEEGVVVFSYLDRSVQSQTPSRRIDFLEQVSETLAEIEDLYPDNDSQTSDDEAAA